MKRIVLIGVFVLAGIASPSSAQEGVDRNSDGLRATLVALSAGSISLQAYDAYSTITALHLGASEANPAMRGVARRPAALIAVKAGVATTTIYAGTQLWRRHHRVAALALMGATTGVMAVVAAHNASVVRTMRARQR